jgi:hypothetical protein
VSPTAIATDCFDVMEDGFSSLWECDDATLTLPSECVPRTFAADSITPLAFICKSNKQNGMKQINEFNYNVLKHTAAEAHMVLGRVKITTTGSNPALTHFPSLLEATVHKQN